MEKHIFYALLLVPGLALGQYEGAWSTAGQGQSIAVSTVASTPLQLTAFSSDARCQQVTIHNTGGIDAYVELAQTSALAVPDIPAAGDPGTSFAVQAGTRVDLQTVNNPWISAKTSSGTTTLVAVCSKGRLRGTTGILLGTGASSTQVQGSAADGSPASGNPVQIAGKDGAGNIQTVLTDTTGAVATFSAAPAVANIVAASQSYTATQAATTIITIPVGTWVGQVSISASVGIAAASSTAGQALGIVTTTGAGVTPTAGQVLECEARAGANAATGTGGSSGNNSCTIDMTINCASGVCTLAGATTQAGTASRVSFSAAGRML